MIDKPKLLIAVDTYYPKTDGTLRFVEEFVKRIKEDFSYHLIVPNLQKKNDNEKHTFLDMSKLIGSSGYKSIKISSKNMKKIKHEVKKSDLVFAQGPAAISFLAIDYAVSNKKKCVFYMHVNLFEFFENFIDNSFTRTIYHSTKFLIRKIINSCSLILIPYPELEAELREEGITAEIKVARLGVDIERFSPSTDKIASKKKVNLPENKTIITYVGRITKEKNTLVLIEAFNKLPDKENYHLLLVGDGQDEHKEKFKELNNCTITGFVKNVEDYLRATDIFVLPSLTETTSLATLEAMATGLPVIVTKVGMMKNYIVKDHNGIFFPRNSATMLALKIEKVINEPEFKEKLGRNARKTVAYSFSWERSINKIKRLLMKEYYS
ncbi:MAG: glycosyltransferase [Nanoarchaeota archaeon]|nr:glycosyltransferase [Nanoarchaeota archaeon]MBU1623155.1 glycosyltransferase [Nanoarchaeota archaeon]MBU1974130.1 glycosyltransferase [Nanoarchaeota archaeon]